jgi:hypothetical protein
MKSRIKTKPKNERPECHACAQRAIIEIRRGDDGYRGPTRAGDFTLCLNCGAVRKFTSDLSLFTPRLDEMSDGSPANAFSH